LGLWGHAAVSDIAGESAEYNPSPFRKISLHEPFAMPESTVVARALCMRRQIPEDRRCSMPQFCASAARSDRDKIFSEHRKGDGMAYDTPLPEKLPDSWDLLSSQT
jgi:hypothetical protein